MSDGGNKRDIELRIRAKDLSSADFKAASAAVKELSAAVAAQVEAAKNGTIKTGELRESMVKLEAAAKGLQNLAGLIDRFKDLSGIVAANQATVEKNSTALSVYRAQLEQTGTAGKGAETKLATMVRQLELSEAALKRNQAAQQAIGETLVKSGLYTTNLAQAQKDLAATADLVGPALTRLNEATLSYNRNLRTAKEEAATLAAEQRTAATQAQAQTVAIDKQRLAYQQRAAALVAAGKQQEAADRAAILAEQAKYAAMLKSAQDFNAQTRLLIKQRQDAETAAANAAVANARQPTTTATATTAAAGVVGARGAAAASTLFGLRPYELQNLSYQVNDIVSGLAMGQRASQILAQQGGQVLQLFNKNLFDVLKYIPAAAAAIGLITVAVGAMSRAFRDAESIREFNALLNLNADGAQYSSRQLADLQKQVRDLGVSWKESGDVIKQGIKAGLDANLIGEFAEAARDTADVTGQKIPEAMRDLVQAFTHGFEAVKKLDQEHGFLTAAQYKQIQALYDQGKGAEAAAKAFALYTAKIAESEKLVLSPFTKASRDLGNAWDDLLVTLGNSTPIAMATKGLQAFVELIDHAVLEIPKMGTAFNNMATSALQAFNRLIGNTAGNDPNAPDLYGGGRAADTAPTTSMSGGRIGPPMSRSMNEKTVRDWLVAHGYSPSAIAAIMGNASVESSFDPGVTNASGHFGLFQWDKERQKPLGGSTDIAAQLELMDRELQKRDADFKTSKQAPRDLAKRFDDVFEVSGGQQLGKRIRESERYGREQLETTDPERREKQLVDVQKIIDDIAAKDATLDRTQQERLVKEKVLQDLKAKGYSDDAANRVADREIAQNRIEFERQERHKKESDQAKYISDGVHADEVRRAGEKAYQDQLAAGNKNFADLEKTRSDGENAKRREIAQEEKAREEEKAIINQKASLDRAAELKDTTSLENRLKAVADQYKAIGQNIDKFTRLFPGQKIEGKSPDEYRADVQSSKSRAEQLETAKFHEDKLKSLQTERNELVKSYNTLLEKGAISSSEAEDKIRQAFERTTPAINAAADEFEKFLSTADKLDGTKIELLTAKIKEFRATATYISPLMKSIKEAVENSFTTGLTTAFETVAEAIGGVIAKTKSWKDVLLSVGQASAKFFADLLKDIAAAILKYEGLKLASSLGIGGDSKGGGDLSIGGIFGKIGGLFGGGSSNIAQGTGLGAGISTNLTTGVTSDVGSVGGGGILSWLFHEGGVVGRGGSPRVVPASYFRNAPRYHTGTVVGLGPDEQTAILKRGEEVLTSDSPRNVMNQAGKGGGGPLAIRNVLVMDESLIPSAMSGTHGERITMAHLVKNAATVRQIVKG